MFKEKFEKEIEPSDSLNHPHQPFPRTSPFRVTNQQITASSFSITLRSMYFVLVSERKGGKKVKRKMSAWV